LIPSQVRCWFLYLQYQLYSLSIVTLARHRSFKSGLRRLMQRNLRECFEVASIWYT
jgi:hypothetical protein